jgi:hypothetical protein
MEGIFKTATVLWALKKVYTIPCHVRSHLNVMLVLQSCTDSVHILPGSSSETFPTPSDVTCDVSNTAVGEDIVAVEELFIAINKVSDIGIKQEEIPEDLTFPDIKAKPVEVSYVCICLYLDTFASVHQCQLHL